MQNMKIIIGFHYFYGVLVKVCPHTNNPFYPFSIVIGRNLAGDNPALSPPGLPPGPL